MPTFSITKTFKTKAVITKRTVKISEAFGIGIDDEQEFTIYDNFEFEINPVKLVALINDLQQTHHLTMDEISLRSGFTAPEIKIAMNRAKELLKKEKERIPVKFQQLIILGTEEELGIINNAIESHKVKHPDKQYQRNGSVLAEICGQ